MDNSILKLNLILDGEPSKAFRNTLPLEFRREYGTFFSSKRLSRILFNMAKGLISKDSRIIDPTCGIGDLLIPFAHYIGRGNDLSETIKLWNNRVLGYDINPLLIKAARIRLLLLAKLINKNLSPISEFPINNIFQNVEVKNFFELSINYNKSDIIVFNPPFGSTLAPEELIWGTGKIQTAALFISKLAETILPGQNIFAILPDVLRSGTRYEKWRESIAKSVDVLEIKLYGRFDKYTDVDVFLAHFQKKKNRKIFDNKWQHSPGSKECLRDYFNVCVGAVVPFRLKEGGKEFFYINSKNALAWKSLKIFTKIRFNGKSHQAPFVLIRRTSSPNDKNRAVPTLVNEPGDFIIENHLFVLSPKDGKLSTCKALIEKLKNPKTNIWFNKYIRCRHLTKSSLLKLPWWSENE